MKTDQPSLTGHTLKTLKQRTWCKLESPINPEATVQPSVAHYAALFKVCKEAAGVEEGEVSKRSCEPSLEK